MKRRDFILFNKKETLNSSHRIEAGLETYANPLTRRQAYHLIRRLNFAPTPDLVSDLTGKSAIDAVNQILGSGSDPLPPKPGQDWDTVMEENPLTVGTQQLRGEIEGRIRSRYRKFIDWWLELMRTDPLPAREKLSLFWSTVWAVEFTYDTIALIPTPLLYLNNQILRKYSMGNHKQFAEEVSLSGAMILYQSLQFSSVKNGQKPNENYMRELLELFTMGTGQYTEADIREGARALTGWRTACYIGEPHSADSPFSTYFDQTPGVHDLGAKEFMGDTIAARTLDDNTEFQVRNEEVGGILNTMYNRRAVAISEFICEKIYRYYVYSNKSSNDAQIISDLAKVFRDNNFEILPALRALFSSKHFFDDGNIGIQIKPPPEFIVGLQTQLAANYSGSRDAIFALDQILYDPPNVGSWEAYRTWLSSTTFPMRVKYAREILITVPDDDLVSLAKKFDSYINASVLIENLEEYFFPMTIDSERHNYYMNLMLTEAGTDESGWSVIDDTNAAKGIRKLINEFIKAPDFQLS